MTLNFETFDVFTRVRFTGNPLAIVHDPDETLNSEQMQAIAREFNLSETVFILPSLNPVHTAKVRIFTPSTELPFAGHPTIGTAVALAEKRLGEVDASTDMIVVLEEGVGPVRLAVTLRPDRPGKAIFDVPKKPGAAPGALDRDNIAAALGISRHHIGFENHKPTRYSCGVPFTYVPVAGLDEIADIQIDRSAWDAAFGQDEHAAAFVYCRETAHAKSSFHARMFAPAMGVDEDPATGAATAAFAGAIAEFDRPVDGNTRLIIEQGIEFGRPSQITLEIDMEGGEIDAVRIGGYAVKVSSGTLSV